MQEGRVERRDKEGNDEADEAADRGTTCMGECMVGFAAGAKSREDKNT